MAAGCNLSGQHCTHTSAVAAAVANYVPCDFTVHMSASCKTYLFCV